MKNNKKPLPLYLPLVVPAIFALLSVRCMKSSYENVRLFKFNETGGIHFAPDESAPREPMPGSISARFAFADGTGGILFTVPYRLTGPGSINRAITTNVLYLTAVDGRMNQLVSKPLLVHKGEGAYRTAFFGADGGFGVAYETRNEDNMSDFRFVCSVYDSRNLAVKNTYIIPTDFRGILGIHFAGEVQSNGDLPLAHFRGDLYALIHEGQFKILKVQNDSKSEKIPLEPAFGSNATVDTADLLVDESGIRAVWSESACTNGKTCEVSFYYAACNGEGTACVKEKIPVRGDSREVLQTVFARRTSRVTIMIQYGNHIWIAEGDRPGRPLGGTRELLSLEMGERRPVAAQMTCSDSDCYVIYHKRDGAYVYSQRQGLKRSEAEYITEAKCSAEWCIRNTNDGIAPRVQ